MAQHSGEKRNEYECDTLYVYNIPEKLNKIPLLFKHFKHYGHIRSIWCNGKTATIGYTTVEEATKAFKSPEAYQNNRFVFIKYHIKPTQAESLLHLAADMNKVKKVAEDVKREIAEQEENEKRQRQKIENVKKINDIEEEINKINIGIAEFQDIAQQIFATMDKETNEEKKKKYETELMRVSKDIKESKKKIKELEEQKKELEALVE